MNQHKHNKLKLQIHGMHCASCEVLIERNFKKVPGVEQVNVSHVTGKANLTYSQRPDLNALQAVIREHGYTASSWADRHRMATQAEHRNTRKDYIELGAVVLILVAGYLILRQFDLFPKLGITDNMSYGLIFAMGLVAAMSTCLAVAGGLLVAVAGKYNEQHPYLTGYQKFKPTLYFNVGRVVSYTVLGGAVGALGSVLTLSPRINGVITIAASLVMIILGFQLLKLFPGLKRFQPKMPKFLAHKIHDATSNAHHPTAPFLLGAATFFLPCGFTQALQLYVLSKGDPVTGAITMLVFSLGTLPALMSLSAISSFAKGAFQRYFLKFSGALVIMLGVFNVNNGLTLTGSSVNLASFLPRSAPAAAQTADDTAVKMVNGIQVVEMKVRGLTYSPSKFTLKQGVPVEWRIDGAQAQGCAQVITVPKLGITEYLPPQSTKTITFTPQEVGTIPFSCTMGMTTRGSAFTVVPNDGPVAAQPAPAVKAVTPPSGGCDPTISNCVAAQQLKMEVTEEQGFYPNTFAVKKGVPVELLMDAKVPLGGCMSVAVIPQYNVTQPLKLGVNKIAFTPTQAGSVDMTCAMGIPMVRFNVT